MSGATLRLIPSLVVSRSITSPGRGLIALAAPFGGSTFLPGIGLGVGIPGLFSREEKKTNEAVASCAGFDDFRLRALEGC